MEQEAFRELLRRYSVGSCSPEEVRFLEDLILRDPIVKQWKWNSDEERLLMGLRIKRAIDKQRKEKYKHLHKNWWNIGVAAALLLLVGVGWWMIRPVEVSNPTVISETTAFPMDGISLKLANGSIVSFDSLKSSFVNKEGKPLAKLDKGKIVYLDDGRHLNESFNNTIYVPNGKQFQVTLPDGTTVWMNTATTLTYPEYFSGNERVVLLEGEAYFDIAKNASKPFKVQIKDGTEVVATGTKFNISAYASDKSVTTTLLEGGVNVCKNATLYKLTPGFQAVTCYENDAIKLQKANLENAIAWRDGYFVFDGQDIVSVMRSVARWYDIQVVFDDNIPQVKFGGTFPIDAELDQLLADLGTLANISFVRTGKEVRIMR